MAQSGPKRAPPVLRHEQLQGDGGDQESGAEWRCSEEECAHM
jgi:hypothetical protein